MLKILLSLLISCPAFASWTCEDDGTQVKANEIWSCGVGTDLTEDDARERALINANNEAVQIYNASTKLRGQSVFFHPRRMHCFREGRYWKCHRLVVVIIGEDHEPAKD
jgi:hypothetical protein